jgi:large subunit ribosomal protein L18
MPRLSVFRSLNHIYAQIVDDARGQTMVSASTRDKEVRTTLKTGGNVAAAKVVGKELAKRAGAAGISRVVFDRGGYAYHGRVKALADAARGAGLKF